ncbi:deoxynucleoside kinase [Candidatus Woesearchaeota archaeon]|nr:deoxynucleoside kinase [Candidatus Woesearchaeota archaeon]
MADRIILIEGNICAGKSSMCRYIKDQKSRLYGSNGGDIVLEFVDPPALKEFYANISQNTEMYELSCLMNRIARHTMAERKEGTLVFDRGVIGGAETFCKNSHNEGNLDDEGFGLYHTILDRAIEKLGKENQQSWLEQTVVYLQVKDVEVLQERQRQRPDFEGEIIPAGYLGRINELYEAFIANIDAAYGKYGLKAPRVITVDGSINWTKEPEFHEDVFRKILDSNT